LLSLFKTFFKLSFALAGLLAVIGCFVNSYLQSKAKKKQIELSRAKIQQMSAK